MSQDISLEEIIKKIINKTGLSREEILKAIDENINKVNGLLTQVGAAFILAEKLKVNIDMESFETLPDEDPSIVPIGKIQEGMRNINVVGRIYRMNPVKTFQRVDGRKGRVAAVFIQDESGKIKVTLWDQKAMLVQNSLSMNQIIAIYNGYVKRGLNNQLELNVGNKGGIKPKPPGIDENQYPEVTIKTCKIGDIDKTIEMCSVKVKVVDKLPIKEFTRKNGTTGKIGKCVIADETGAMNLVFWTNDISEFEKLQVGHTLEIENGSVRENNYSNQIEMQFGPSTKIRKTNDDIEIKQTSTTNIGKSVSGEIIDDFSNIPERGFSLTLKGKVIGKSDVTNWSKNGRDGAVARLTLQDEGLHSLTVVFWTEHIDSFNKLSIGDLVEITNAYTKVNRNNVEANLSKNSTVNTHGKQKVSPTVMKIDQLKENQALLTVEGRILQVDEPKEITTRTGSNIKLVNFTIADESGAINCVAWRDQVDEITALNTGDLIGLKNVKSQFSSFLNALEISLTRDSKVYIPND
ncbi:hypothetical protein GF325_04340, partial [Candidatus Bathyarchaeota archaeon]|nr:hypothetical protein [Candidatus Bathyarchaeota archaeon]